MTRLNFAAYRDRPAAPGHDHGHDHDGFDANSDNSASSPFVPLDTTDTGGPDAKRHDHDAFDAALEGLQNG